MTNFDFQEDIENMFSISAIDNDEQKVNEDVLPRLLLNATNDKDEYELFDFDEKNKTIMESTFSFDPGDFVKKINKSKEGSHNVFNNNSANNKTNTDNFNLDTTYNFIENLINETSNDAINQSISSDDASASHFDNNSETTTSLNENSRDFCATTPCSSTASTPNLNKQSPLAFVENHFNFDKITNTPSPNSDSLLLQNSNERNVVVDLIPAAGSARSRSPHRPPHNPSSFFSLKRDDDDDDHNDTKLQNQRLLRNKKNAETAKKNREKKKNYLENLEKKVNELTEKNQNITQENEQLKLKLNHMEEQVQYFSNILANQDAISQILRSVPYKKKVPPVCSEKDDFEYFSTFTNKCNKPNPQPPSAGICLHFKPNHISLEYCLTCSQRSQNDL